MVADSVAISLNGKAESTQGVFILLVESWSARSFKLTLTLSGYKVNQVRLCFFFQRSQAEMQIVRLFNQFSLCLVLQAKGFQVQIGLRSVCSIHSS